MELPGPVPIAQDFDGPMPDSELGSDSEPGPLDVSDPEPCPGDSACHAGITAEIASAQSKLDQLIAMFADKIQRRPEGKGLLQALR